MPTKEKNFITDPSVLAAYKKMIDAVPGVQWKGKTHPYLSMNGNMYSSISKDHIIGIRLSPTDCEKYLFEYKTNLFEPFPGYFQKGYVPIPKDMHKDVQTMKKWFRKSYEFAGSLKPKPTTKKKTTKKT